jgi:hypothetical protein
MRQGLRWALAGRSADAAGRRAARHRRQHGTGVVVADAQDAAALDALARSGTAWC